MLEETKDLKRRLSQLGNIADRVKILRNSFRGKTAYVVSCGPSLSEIDLEDLKSRLDGKLVITVKQAYNLLSEQSDFHVTNFVHHNQYDYAGDAIALELMRPGQPLGKADFHMPIDMKAALNWKSYKSTVSVNGNYDDYTFSNTIKRPLGPGIFHEMVVFLCEHIGCSKIKTIGFDCTKASTHFYGTTKVSKERQAQLDKEMEVVVDNFPTLVNWLSSKNIELEILSDINPVAVKKITLADL